MTLTPDDVRKATFGKAKRSKLGYDEYEVDVFLDRVEATLRGQDSLTAEDVMAAKFTPRQQRKRGYDADAVDAFLDDVALTLMRQTSRPPMDDGRDDGFSPQYIQPEPPPRRLPPQDAAPAPPPRPAPPPGPQRDLSPPPRPESRSRSPQLDARDMHNVAFISPPPGQPAYDEDEVDAFIDRVKATLAGQDTLTAQDVLSARFNPPKPGSRGYHEAGVSAFLVLVATSLKQLAGRTDISNTPPMRSSDASIPQLTPEVIRNVTLSRPPLGERGYVEDEVDAFLDRVEATLRGTDTLTAQDVHEVRFHELPPDRGGYDQNEVEALLDLVEERLGNEVYRRWHA